MPPRPCRPGSRRVSTAAKPWSRSRAELGLPKRRVYTVSVAPLSRRAADDRPELPSSHLDVCMPSIVARFYVTTPIYYVNDVPHIGATPTRPSPPTPWPGWHRLLGEDVFFLTGTDEHGLKVQRAAEANGLTPREQADQHQTSAIRQAWKPVSTSPTTISSALLPSPAIIEATEPSSCRPLTTTGGSN